MVRIGQPTKVGSDFYKGAVTYEGKVIGILSGTRDVFQWKSIYCPQSIYYERVIGISCRGDRLERSSSRNFERSEDPFSGRFIMPEYNSSVIVLGTSIAGLLAAKALSNHFQRVTLVDRDVLPDDTAVRRGVPQAAHAHGLRAGRRAAADSRGA